MIRGKRAWETCAPRVDFGWGSLCPYTGGCNYLPFKRAACPALRCQGEDETPPLVCMRSFLPPHSRTAGQQGGCAFGAGDVVGAHQLPTFVQRAPPTFDEVTRCERSRNVPFNVRHAQATFDPLRRPNIGLE